MKKTLRTKSSNNRIVFLLMILSLTAIFMSGCGQPLPNTATNTTATANINANANTNDNSNVNSNVTANNNANVNTSVVPSNSAANTDNQASNTATATKEEVPLTEEAKAFAFSLVGEWSFDNPAGQKIMFTGDKYEVKRGDQFIDKGSYRVLNENTVEINSVQLNKKWNATMKVEDGGNRLDWRQLAGEHFTLTRVKPN